MKALGIYPRHNTPGVNPRTGRPWRDATGAFQPEAQAWGRVLLALGHNVQLSDFDNLLPYRDRRQGVDRAIRAWGLEESGLVAFFCHGWSSGLQTGHNMATLPPFTLEPSLWVLYACSAGSDALPGAPYACFASELARAQGDMVFAHADVPGTRRNEGRGHTTRNPHVKIFGPDGAGRWAVDPSETERWAAWAGSLRGQRRFTYPLEDW